MTARRRPAWAGLLSFWLAAVLLAVTPAPGGAQVFLAARANPEFTVGPLFVRATVTPALEPVTIDVLWSLVVPPGRSAAGLEQDLYLLWPGAVVPETSAGRPDPGLAKYIEARGFTVIEEGRVPLLAQSLYQMDGNLPAEPIAGGAPFVTFVRQGGALGLTPAATYVRIPWNPRLVNRAWLVNLKMQARGLTKPKPATWAEETFWGLRHRLELGFNDVRHRAVFPMYFEHRDRVVRLAEDLAQIQVFFTNADRLKIDEMYPQSSRRQLSETLDLTDTVSMFLDRSEGIQPQVLTVQFGYFTSLQSWAPVMIPVFFFVLGNILRPLLETTLKRAGRTLAARVQLGPPRPGQATRESGVIVDRETLARIRPGETTYDEVVRLCGPGGEEFEQTNAPDRRTIIYRGRRIVPERRRTLGWFATVSQWMAEQHEVEIELEGNLVRDVQARVRKTRLTEPKFA